MSQIIRTSTRHAIYTRDGHSCVYCGCCDHDELSLDHVVPQSKDGSNHRTNLVTCCLSCNKSKGDADVRVWLRRILETEQDVEWVMNNVRNAKRRTLRRGLAVVIESCRIMGRAVPRSFLGAQALVARPTA